jgi:hypothetical protein
MKTWSYFTGWAYLRRVERWVEGYVLDKEGIYWLAWLWRNLYRVLDRGKRAGLS